MRCHAGKPLNIRRSLRFPEDITRVNWNNESGRGNADNQSNPGCPSKPVNSLDRARHFIAFPQDLGTCVDPVLLSSGAGHSARQKQEEREWERERTLRHSCQLCLQLHGIKHSSDAIFTVCDVKQSAFHSLSNDVETACYLAVSKREKKKILNTLTHTNTRAGFPF